MSVRTREGAVFGSFSEKEHNKTKTEEHLYRNIYLLFKYGKRRFSQIHTQCKEQ